MTSEMAAIQSGVAVYSPQPPTARAAPAPDRAAPARAAPALDRAAVGVSYEVNQETGSVIIKMVDQATREVIREIPSEEIQRMSRALEAVLGRLYDQRG